MKILKRLTAVILAVIFVPFICPIMCVGVIACCIFWIFTGQCEFMLIEIAVEKYFELIQKLVE